MKTRGLFLGGALFVFAGGVASTFIACGSSHNSGFTNQGENTDHDGGSTVGDGSVGTFADTGTSSVEASALGTGDFEDDPPPSWCGQGPDPYDAAIYGTVECPSDKNREGCPCTTSGEKAACWTGLRADRGIGVCKDGQTTCQQQNENGLEWGPCVGEVLPSQGVDAGASACKCFSTGKWAVTNTVPCVGQESNDTVIGAVSTFITGDGGISCPTTLADPLEPQAGTTWSTDTLEADCAGTFTLCFTIKAGNVDSPQASDCVVGQSCVQNQYLSVPNVTTKLADLPSWTGSNVACAQTFANTGGYGEMSVYGESVECEEVGNQATPYVFQRVGYCPLINPPANCVSGGTGNF